MADISKIIFPSGKKYNIKDTKARVGSNIYIVKGTQTETTGSWTGNIDIDALYDGLTISYYLPRTGSGNASLNLTLKNGTTTGAVPVYATSTTRATTHYGAGSTIILTYWSAGSISVNGTSTTQDRWTSADYGDSNTITGVKGDKETNYRTGNVNITPDNIGAVKLSGDTMTGPLILQNSSNSASLILKPQNISTNYCTIGFNLHDIPNIPNTWFFYHDIRNNKLKISHRNQTSSSANTYFYVDSEDQDGPNFRVGGDLMIGHPTTESEGCKMRYNTSTQSLDFIFS